MNVEDLIKNSLQELQKISWENEISNKDQKSKLLFPKYREDEQGKCQGREKKRISEQEARFLFIRELENAENTDFYYSVETPTQGKYTFSKDGEKVDPIIDENGQSGKIDVCIYDTNLNRKHLIEFKALNKDPHDFEKDFIKLKYEPKVSDEPNYFVHILKSYNKGTIEDPEHSLIEKYKAAFKITCKGAPPSKNVIVCLCILEIPKKYKPKEQIIWFNENDYPKKLNELLNEI